MTEPFTEHHQRMLELHSMVAEPLHVAVAVDLSDVTDRRFRRLTDDVDVEALRPSARVTWEATHDVREGLTAAVYHQRNVRRVEEEIARVCRASYARKPVPPYSTQRRWPSGLGR